MKMFKSNSSPLKPISVESSVGSSSSSSPSSTSLSSLSPSSGVVVVHNSNNLNTDSNNNNNKNNRLKNYLIDKLLNEASSLAPSSMPPVQQINEKHQEEFNLNMDKRSSESREDLASEAGTYTIDEPGLAEQKLIDVSNAVEANKTVQEEEKEIHTVVDVLTARAAIDETFGIIKRPVIQNEQILAETTMPLQRSKQKVINRTRNKTYSLTKDFAEAEIADTLPSTPPSPQSAENELSSSSIRKTRTYNVIHDKEEKEDLRQSCDMSHVSHFTSVGTEILLGDTEKLIEQLKKRRTEKKQQLQEKLNTKKMSSSSASSTASNVSSCSSSTSSACPDSQHQQQQQQIITKSECWTIPTRDSIDDENYNCLSTRANINFKLTDDNNSYLRTNNSLIESHKSHGGVAYEFICDGQKSNPVSNGGLSNSTKPVLSSSIMLNHANLSKLNDISGGSSTMTPSSSLTITRRFHRTTKDDDAASVADTVLATPKSGISLGAKIQAKAKENNVSKTSPRQSSTVRRRGSETSLNTSRINFEHSPATLTTPTSSPQYTNRTVYLRQQSARAKRDSLDKSETNLNELSRKSVLNLKPSNGILKTPSKQNITNRSTSNSGSPSSKLGAATTKMSRSNSRNTSPYSGNANSSLMTTSLTMPSNSGLSHEHDSFHRRKNYDPLKAVEQERQKQRERQKQQQVMNKPSNLKNNISNENDNELLSDSSMSSFSIPVQKLTENIQNKQTYEKILQSTLQRLCIRLIQMSTGVLDKIGDDSSKSNDSNNLFTSGATTELERMQQLAKLVHSMQLVHDHIQIIDSTLFNPKPEEAFIKELTKIRQEVDSLKQKASMSTSTNSLLNSPMQK